MALYNLINQNNSFSNKPLGLVFNKGSKYQEPYDYKKKFVQATEKKNKKIMYKKKENIKIPSLEYLDFDIDFLFFWFL